MTYSASVPGARSCGVWSLEGEGPGRYPALMIEMTERQRRARPYIRAWLWFAAFLVFMMVIVGGATRLTDSGLSITEWQPLLGAIPPLGEEAWQEAFAKYREIPEYHVINAGMTLEQFKYIYAYSPYHRVKESATYPAVLMVSGDSDTRVAPLHARKMAAMLQSVKENPNPVLLKYDTEAGHAGTLPLSRQIDNLTDELSFLVWQLG